MLGKAIEDIAMELDREGTVNFEQLKHLKHLIQKECDKRGHHYATLKEKYKRLEHDLTTQSIKQQQNLLQKGCAPTNDEDGTSKKNKSNPNATSTPR